jgi:predicted nucleic acid-binding protein
MNEFIDTNVLVYAHQGGAGEKHRLSIELIDRLTMDSTGCVSIQILLEFYAVATRKLGMPITEAAEVVAGFGRWTLQRPRHSDLLEASTLQRRHKISWWDALVVQSALAAGCSTLWTEDLQHGQKFGRLLVRNPFAS